jgi:hypothetical protein
MKLAIAERAASLAADRRRLEKARRDFAKVEQDASAQCLLYLQSHPRMGTNVKRSSQNNMRLAVLCLH